MTVKPATRTSGIRMPTELYDWIDRVAAKKSITRSECVYRLVSMARKGFAPIAEAYKPMTVNVAWVGVFLSSAVITLSFEGFIRLMTNT